MKKNFLVAVATVILVAGFATTVWSQTEKTGLAGPDSILVTAPLNKVQVMPDSCTLPSGTRVVLTVLYSGGTEKAKRVGLDPNLWGSRGRVALDWVKKHGLIVNSPVDYREGLVGERGVVIRKDEVFYSLVNHAKQISQLDERVAKAQQTADSAYVLADEAKKNARTNASGIDSLRLEFNDYKQQAQKKSNLALLRVGFGTIAVSYTDIEPKAIPVLRLEANLSQRFGLQAEGGVVPVGSFNNEAVWDGVFHPAVFWRPASFIKILAGYSLATNFYESDFAIAESRDDGFLAGLELSVKFLGLNLYVGGGYLRSNADGGFITAGVVF